MDQLVKRVSGAGIRRAGLLFGVIAMVALAGCATDKLPPVPATGPSVDYNYHIGVSDTVNVIVWRNPELSMSVPVRPDGNAARIFRVSEGGKLYSVRLRDLVKRGDITANADIRPGDILIIPQSWF